MLKSLYKYEYIAVWVIVRYIEALPVRLFVCGLFMMLSAAKTVE
jgi:hypothetical protein